MKHHTSGYLPATSPLIATSDDRCPASGRQRYLTPEALEMALLKVEHLPFVSSYLCRDCRAYHLLLSPRKRLKGRK